MNKLLYLLIILTLLFSSCKKKHTVHIKAINAVTGAPYAGLPYGIKGTKTVTNGEKLVFEHNGILDANGEASPTIKVNENLSLSVGCQQPPNTCYTKDISAAWNAKANPSPSFQFEYAECANFNLEIHNINCQGPSDSFTYKRTWFNGDDQGIFQTQTGCYDFVGNFITLPMGNYKYEWEVTRNGLTTYHDSLFSLTENQFYTFVLNY